MGLSAPTIRVHMPVGDLSKSVPGAADTMLAFCDMLSIDRDSVASLDFGLKKATPHGLTRL